MRHRNSKTISRLLCGSAAIALSWSGFAHADDQRAFNIEAQPLATALMAFGNQSGHAVMAPMELMEAKVSRGFSAPAEPEVALAQLLEGTGLTFTRTGDTFAIVQGGSGDPQPQGAAGDGAEGTVDTLVVTAQKREEDIQDVPIAISAFTQEQLTDRQVAGGPDLMTQVPNFTFTKTNFSSYSIQIRGIGTQAISATTDPAVAIAFNNTPFVRNRFFEQEFYDLQRVEVLRGPQGTLYGRNATAGVVNIISNKPSFGYEAKLSADVSNYNSTRFEGMINLPLVEDVVAVRLAGAWTKRDGYATNQLTGNPIDGRDLWSTRLSLRVSPGDRLDANLIWEHFEEDDDRLRSGKQLCNTHEVTEVAGFPTTHYQTIYDDGQGGTIFSGIQATFSRGCLPASLYSPDSFQTPNGIALPYYVPLGAVFLPIPGGGLGNIDPYVSRFQSHDLRVIESTVDPGYKAKSDVVEAQVSYDLTDTLTLSSETAWATDFIFSTQDFNRFNTAPGAWAVSNGPDPYDPTDQPGLAYLRGILDENGVFCDPQVGCSDRLVAVDLSTATSSHFSQEFRLASNYEGDFNFSLGANFLRYDTEDKYYVFINSLSLISAISPYQRPDPVPDYVPGVTDNKECLVFGPVEPDPNQYQSILNCTYMDPNPIENLNDLGHNYFLSRNPYKLISYAVFGEAYYQISDALKLSGGLRWTVDKKEAPRIPSWVLASQSIGYGIMEVIELEWREPTGRVTLDWKPDLPFTDETLVYGSFAHGYKAGGANPPPYGIAIYNGADVADAIREESLTNPKTFDPEFVNAFEIGAKNTMLDGRLTANLAAFYYDYEGYQISQIVDRSATNLNFDAEVWGLELEADWRPLENLKLGLKLGYENTRVADGERAIDIMDRTAGMPGWILVRPFPSIPSNCVLPEWLFLGNRPFTPENPELVNLGTKSGGGPGGCEYAYLLDQDPVTRADYMADPAAANSHQGVINYTQYSTDPAMFPGWPVDMPITDRTYPGWNPELDYGANNGQGFFKDLSGNELPNAPHFTATITGDFTVPLPADWLMTLHTDLYYQSEAWTRIFNTEGYDKLKAYTNVNLAAIFTNEPGGWKVMAYVKNVFDRDSITGAFLNSDDTGLTTNVFLTEPRLYGLRVTKDWNGGAWWTGANPNHVGPYPLTVEIGGQVQRHDAPYETIQPSFMDIFPDSVDTSRVAQNRDLDWGDGREVTLTYRPGSGPWAVSARYRTGETNSGNARVVEREVGECDPKYEQYLCGKYLFPNWSETNARSREEFQTIDFAIGRDVGFGGLSRAQISAGLRYAKLESTTFLNIDGSPDNAFPKYVLNDGREYHRYQAILEAQREFEGTGPVVTFDAASDILGSDETGRLAVDWSVGAGMLFGKQTSTLAGTEIQSDYQNSGFYALFWSMADEVTPTPVAERRSDSANVPLVSGSLGLSYEIQRVKIGAGYRWERYFDALDTGQGESRQDDRTIDGPYFKLAIGFGG